MSLSTPGRKRIVPASGPAVWSVAELTPADWMLPLGTDDAAEIVATLSAIVAGEPEPPLPRSAALFAGLRERLRDGRGFALLRGLAPDQAPGGAEALLGLLARELGTAGPGAAQSLTSEEAPGFHDGDSEIVALLRLRQTEEGERMSLVSAGAAHNGMLLRDRSLLAELYNALPLAGATGLGARAVFAQQDSGFIGRFAPDAIAAAEAAPHNATLTGRQRAAIEMLSGIVSDAAFVLRLEMRPGDLLLLDPRRVWLRRKQRLAMDALAAEASYVLLRLGTAE